MPRVLIVSFFLFLLVGYPHPAVQAQVQLPNLDYATFPVEATAYGESEEQPGTYSSEGTFAGLGRMSFSARRMSIQFNGLIGGVTYNFSSDEYLITSLIPINDTEYTFEAVFDGQLFRRPATGRIQWTTPTTGRPRTIEYFEINEWGQTTQGVLRRYSHPLSITASEMIERYPEFNFAELVVIAP